MAKAKKPDEFDYDTSSDEEFVDELGEDVIAEEPEIVVEEDTEEVDEPEPGDQDPAGERNKSREPVEEPEAWDLRENEGDDAFTQLHHRNVTDVASVNPEEEE